MRTLPLRRLWHTVVASATSAVVAAAQGQVAPLSLEEALALAAARSQQLVAEDAAAAAAQEQAIAAGTRPDPVLTMGVDNLPIEGPHELNLTRDFMTMRSIGVERELVGAAKRGAQTALHTREAEAADAARSLALARLQQQTAVAWFDRLFSDRATQLLVAQRASAAAPNLRTAMGRGAKATCSRPGRLRRAATMRSQSYSATSRSRGHGSRGGSGTTTRSGL
jgi:hypothetical protein